MLFVQSNIHYLDESVETECSHQCAARRQTVRCHQLVSGDGRCA